MLKLFNSYHMEKENSGYLFSCLGVSLWSKVGDMDDPRSQSQWCESVLPPRLAMHTTSLTETLMYTFLAVLFLLTCNAAGMSAWVLSGIWLFVAPWTVARQAPLSMGFSRKEYWSGLPWPPPGDLPGPGIEPGSPAWAGRFFTAEPAGKPPKLSFSWS